MKIERLPCKLTNDELRVKGEELARLISNMSEVELAKKAKTAEFNGRIGDLQEKQDALSHEINQKAEVREVKCEEEFNWETNVVETIRTDTGAVIHTRIIRPEERQRKMEVVDMGERRAGRQEADDEASATD